MVRVEGEIFCECGGLVLDGLCNQGCDREEEEERERGREGMISKKLKIAGMFVDVEEVTLGSNQLGESQFKLGKILIDKDLGLELKEDTLIHEVIHMIASANALELEEIDVAVLAVNLSQYLRDN